MTDSIYDFSNRLLNGKEKSMADYKGKVLLIVNTASKCGFTPQYAGLEKIYEEKKDKGFEILGFPCNQFGKQEPGNSTEIGEFCSLNYGVSFTMFDKVDVNGDAASPLYRFLKKQAPGLLSSEGIKWNFTKFLVDRKGNVVKRFASIDTPAKIEKEIDKLLNA
jgi:glutathione peroxidase